MDLKLLIVTLLVEPGLQQALHWPAQLAVLADQCVFNIVNADAIRFKASIKMQLRKVMVVFGAVVLPALTV